MNKRPRHYAMAYLAVKGDPAKEKQAVAGCPVEWRELVRKHVQLIEEKRRLQHVTQRARNNRVGN
jgi:hypothetical protein